MELNAFNSENQKLINTDPEKYLKLIEEELDFLQRKAKRSLFARKWKEEISMCTMQECLVLNSIGDFDKSVSLMKELIAQNLDTNCEQNCKFSFTCLFLYVEALVYLGELAKAKTYYDKLSELFDSWKTKFNYNYQANYKLRLMKAILYYQNGDEENSRIELESVLNHSMELDENVRSTIYYYLAVIDYNDSNFIDSAKKINKAKDGSYKFYYKKSLELESLINIRKCELESNSSEIKHQSFKEFGDCESRIVDVQLNNDGSRVATVNTNGYITVWDTEKEMKLVEFNDNTEIYKMEYAYKASFSFSKDSKLLTFGVGVGIVKMYDLDSKSIKWSCNFFPDVDYENLDTGAYYYEFTYTSFSNNDKYLLVVPSAERFDPQEEDASGYSNPIYFRKFYILNIENGKILFEYTFDEGKIGSVQFSDDDRYLAVGVLGKEIKLWELGNFKEVYSDNDFVWIPDPLRIGMTNNIVFGLDSSVLAYSSKGSKIKLLRMKKGNEICIDNLSLPNETTSCALEFDNYNKNLISADFYSYQKQSELRIWDITEGIQISSSNIKKAFVQQIVLNMENDEIWILYPPTVEIRRYGTMEVIKRFDPYKWYNSSYMLGNPASISKNGNAMAIGYENKLRFHS